MCACVRVCMEGIKLIQIAAEKSIKLRTFVEGDKIY